MTKEQFVKMVIETIEKQKGNVEVAIGVFTYFGEYDTPYIQTFVKREEIGLHYNNHRDEWYIEIDEFQLFQSDYEKSWSFNRWDTFEEYVTNSNPSSGYKNDWKGL